MRSTASGRTRHGRERCARVLEGGAGEGGNSEEREAEAVGGSEHGLKHIPGDGSLSFTAQWRHTMAQEHVIEAL